MTAKVKWRAAVFADLKAKADALGWKEFDEDKLNGLIDKNAEVEPDENGFPPSLHKAYVRAASFSDLGRKRFLNAFRGTFEKPSASSKKTRTYRKKKGGDVIPSMIDPDCKACSGKGVSSKGRQCTPCTKNGVKVKVRPKGDSTGPAPAPPTKRPPPPPPKGGGRNRKAASRAQPPKPPLPPPPPKGKKKPPAPPPPPPPSKRRPPPPPPKKKGGSKAKAKPPPAKPLPLPKTGKTYGMKAGVSPSRLKAPVFFAICIQVRLDSSYDESVVVEELNRYVVEQTGFGANVQEAKKLGSEVFDLRVHYAIHVTEVFDAIEAHEWVKAAKARPVQDLGQGEPLL